VQDDDTTRQHAGSLSPGGGTKIFQVSTTALCVDGDVEEFLNASAKEPQIWVDGRSQAAVAQWFHQQLREFFAEGIH
jgi:hypothetical protein